MLRAFPRRPARAAPTIPGTAHVTSTPLRVEAIFAKRERSSSWRSEGFTCEEIAVHSSIPDWHGLDAIATMPGAGFANRTGGRVVNRALQTGSGRCKPSRRRPSHRECPRGIRRALCCLPSIVAEVSVALDALQRKLAEDYDAVDEVSLRRPARKASSPPRKRTRAFLRECSARGRSRSGRKAWSAAKSRAAVSLSSLVRRSP